MGLSANSFPAFPASPATLSRLHIILVVCAGRDYHIRPPRPAPVHTNLLSAHAIELLIC